MTEDSQPRHLEIYETAIVVFIQARGTNQRDAEHGAMLALYQSLPKGILLPVRSPRGTENVRVVDHIEVGMAAGNGYLRTEPTHRAFRQYQEDENPERYI